MESEIKRRKNRGCTETVACLRL